MKYDEDDLKERKEKLRERKEQIFGDGEEDIGVEERLKEREREEKEADFLHNLEKGAIKLNVLKKVKDDTLDDLRTIYCELRNLEVISLSLLFLYVFPFKFLSFLWKMLINVKKCRNTG